MLRFTLFLFFPLTLISAGLPFKDTYILTKEYTVTIRGTSNLKNWKDSVGTVTGVMTVDVKEDGRLELQTILIKMKVSSIKSDMGQHMDSKTYKALKGDKYPEITFQLDTPVTLIQVNTGESSLFVNGYLTLAGVCRPVIMKVTALKFRQGQLQFEGSQQIKMTDFGVRPPTAFLGAVKAGPDITINFKTNFTNK